MHCCAEAKVANPWARNIAVPAIAVITTIASVGQSPITSPISMNTAISTIGVITNASRRMIAMLAISPHCAYLQVLKQLRTAR